MRISDWSSDVCSSDLSRSSCNLPYLGALQPPVIAFQKSRSSCNPFRHMLTLTSVIAFQKSRSSCNTFEQRAMGSEDIAFQKSSEERRVGKACVSTCSYRWSTYL